MKITEITASIGRTKQFVQYQPHNFHSSAKVELAEGESAEEAFALAYIEVENSLKKEIAKFESVFNKKQPIQVDVPDTKIDDLSEGSYIVWEGGNKKLLTITERKSGLNKGRKYWFADYDKDDIACQPRNITKDLTI